MKMVKQFRKGEIVTIRKRNYKTRIITPSYVGRTGKVIDDRARARRTLDFAPHISWGLGWLKKATKKEIERERLLRVAQEI